MRKCGRLIDTEVTPSDSRILWSVSWLGGWAFQSAALLSKSVPFRISHIYCGFPDQWYHERQECAQPVCDGLGCYTNRYNAYCNACCCLWTLVKPVFTFSPHYSVCFITGYNHVCFIVSFFSSSYYITCFSRLFRFLFDLQGSYCGFVNHGGGSRQIYQVLNASNLCVTC